MTALELIDDILQVVRDIDPAVGKEEAKNVVSTKLLGLVAVAEGTTDLTSESGERLMDTIEESLPFLFKLMDEHFEDRFDITVPPKDTG